MSQMADRRGARCTLLNASTADSVRVALSTGMISLNGLSLTLTRKEEVGGCGDLTDGVNDSVSRLTGLLGIELLLRVVSLASLLVSNPISIPLSSFPTPCLLAVSHFRLLSST